MSEVTARIPKPVLRGLHNASIKQNLAVAMGLTVISGLAFHFMYIAPKKQRYADFYKNRDTNKSFERMKNAGLLQSVKD
ncbi:cytochrome c oxidase subunit 6C-like [Uranotaenia lowii]|uniref:cytochrome c oxidase subunit 6C-like n=1 Tax=Uranotaenia lowii TaxID=190385 RepID=UPI00247A4846|nr:cytochrome c oxidase subunit 6C-like [Uranotaenia lowii]